MTIRTVYYDDETKKYFYGQPYSQFRAAKAAVRAGVRNARIVCIGDSTTAGAYGQGGTTTAWGSNNRIYSYPKVLGDIFASTRGIRSKNNSWFAHRGIPTLAETHAHDNRVTYTGTWVLNGELGIGGSPWQSFTSGDQFTFVPDDAYDTVEAYVVTYPAVPGGASVSIDAGASIGQILLDGPPALTKFVFKKPLGTGTVKLTVLPSSGNNVIQGIITYDSSQKEISVLNASIASSGLTTYINPAGAPWDALSELTVLTPDLVIVDSTINEFWYGTVAQYRAWLQTVLDACNAQKYDVLMVSGNPINPSTGVSQVNQDAYVAMARKGSEDNNIPFVDVYARWGSTWTAANALGFIDDTVHPKGAGYADIAAAVFAAID